MTLSANSAMIAAFDALFFDRLAMTRCYALTPFPVVKLVYGLNRGLTTMEAKQNTAKHFSALLRDAGTGLGALLSPAILSSLTVQIKKGGLTTYSAISPVLTAVGSTGLVDLALTAGHLDTLGLAAINIIGPGIVPNDDLFIDVVAVDKNDAVRFGLSSIPNAAAAASGGLPTLGASLPDANAGSSGGLPILGVSIPVAAAGTSGGLPTIGGTIPNAVAGTSAGLATKQNVDDARDSIIAVLPTANAVLDSLLEDHSVAGSVADGIAIASGLLQGNFFMDTVVSDANGQTSARLRLWRDQSGAGGATSGGSGEGEFATFQVTTTYSAPGQVATHRVVRVIA